MRYFILGVILTANFYSLKAQNIAINITGADPDGSALLDVSGANHGLLVPRVALTATAAAGPITSPATSLLVYNTANVSDVTPGYYYWNGSAWVRFFDATVNSADHDWYEVGGTNSPNDINDDIFTEGNVGIGTNAPTANLHLHDDGNNSPNILFDEGGSESTWWMGMRQDNNGAADDEFDIGTGLTPGSNTLVTIATNGNVGVGTNSPSEKLHIAGSIRMTDGNQANGRILVSDVNGTGSWQDASSISPSSMEDMDGDTKIQLEETADEDRIRFDTKGVERMRIDSTGGVLVGNMSLGSESDAQSLSSNAGSGFLVTPSIYTTNIEAANERGANSTGIAIGLGKTSQNESVGNDNISLYTRGLSRVFLNSDGELGVGTMDPTHQVTISDDRASLLLIENTDNSLDAPTFTFRKSRSSGANLSGDQLAGLDISTLVGGGAYDVSQFIMVVATEDHNATSAGFKLGFRTVGNGSLSDVEKMVIDHNGYVGIGETIPEELLHVSSLTSGNAIFKLEADTDNNNESDNPSIRLIQDGGQVGALIGMDETNFGGNNFGIHRRFGNNEYFDGITMKLSNGNIGIGTTNPTAKLQIGDFDAGSVSSIAVSGSATGTFEGGEIRLYNAADHDDLVEFYRADVFKNYFRIGRSGFTDFTIDSIGNIGIGTSEPEIGVHILSKDQSGFLIERDPTGPDGKGAVVQFKDSDGDQWLLGPQSTNSIADNRFFISGPTTPAGSTILTLDDNTRNIGIGTTSPSARVHIRQSADNSSSGFLITNLNDIASTGVWIENNGVTSATHIGGPTASPNALVIENSTGNIGIGTETPSNAIHVQRSGSGTFARFETSSNSGADASIVIKGARNNSTTNSISSVIFSNYDSNEGAGTEYTMGQISSGMHDASGETGFLRFYTNSGASLTEKMRIDKDGNVGIGTATPSEKLEVSGNVLATSFIATTAGAGAYQYNSGTNMTVPDYVFEKHFRGESKINPFYTMSSLLEVEKYIKKNHHLPRVPSRSELLEDGVINVQSMQMVTLEKVEELFIHSIEQEKEIEKQRKQNIELITKINAQEERFEKQLKEQKDMLLQEIKNLKSRLDN